MSYLLILALQFTSLMGKDKDKSILSKFPKIIKRRQSEAWLPLAFRWSSVDGVRAWSSTVHVIKLNFCAADFDTKAQFF